MKKLSAAWLVFFGLTLWSYSSLALADYGTIKGSSLKVGTEEEKDFTIDSAGKAKFSATNVQAGDSCGEGDKGKMILGPAGAEDEFLPLICYRNKWHRFVPIDSDPNQAGGGKSGSNLNCGENQFLSIDQTHNGVMYCKDMPALTAEKEEMLPEVKDLVCFKRPDKTTPAAYDCPMSYVKLLPSVPDFYNISGTTNVKSARKVDFNIKEFKNIASTADIYHGLEQNNDMGSYATTINVKEKINPLYGVMAKLDHGEFISKTVTLKTNNPDHLIELASEKAWYTMLIVYQKDGQYRVFAAYFYDSESDNDLAYAFYTTIALARDEVPEKIEIKFAYNGDGQHKIRNLHHDDCGIIKFNNIQYRNNAWYFNAAE